MNGFLEGDLEDGEPIENVRMEVEKYITMNYLFIMSGGAADFLSLDIPPSTVNFWNLQQHWTKQNGQYTKLGEKVMQGIGLRSLYYHYFNVDLHAGQHSAEKDALATMKLFREVYVKIKTTDLDSRTHKNVNDEFSIIKTIR